MWNSITKTSSPAMVAVWILVEAGLECFVEEYIYIYFLMLRYSFLEAIALFISPSCLNSCRLFYSSCAFVSLLP